MTILTCTLHDPKAGLRWISETQVSRLLQIFDQVIITASPLTDQVYLAQLEAQGCRVYRQKKNIVYQIYYAAIAHGVESGAECIFYCDFDRVMHWMRTYPAELVRLAKRLSREDYVIGMRGPREYTSHHAALYDTEQLPNRIISEAMGEKVQRDYLSGCFGFSKRAATCVVKNSRATSFAFFGEWPMLMKRYRFKPAYLVCKGLEWETPDQHQDEVKRCGGVEAYREQLSTPAEWKRRVAMATEFVDLILPKMRGGK